MEISSVILEWKCLYIKQIKCDKQLIDMTTESKYPSILAETFEINCVSPFQLIETDKRTVERTYTKYEKKR